MEDKTKELFKNYWSDQEEMEKLEKSIAFSQKRINTMSQSLNSRFIEFQEAQRISFEIDIERAHLKQLQFKLKEMERV